VNPGLNLMAFCNCCNEYVVIQIGYNQKNNEFFDIGSMRNYLKCSNNKCKSKIKSSGLLNIMLYRSVWKYEYELEFKANQKSGVSFNPNDLQYVTFDEGEVGNTMSCDYFFLKVIKKEFHIQSTKNEGTSSVQTFTSKFHSKSKQFNEKIEWLEKFNFKGEDLIGISKYY